MNVRLQEIDARIAEATRIVEERTTAMAKAREELADLEARRRTAVGRLGNGDAVPAADIAQLRQAYIAARRAVQDAELAVHEVQANLAAITDTREPAERQIAIEHLAALLEARAAFAAEFEAQLAVLVATGRLYRTAVQLSNRYGQLAGVGVVRDDMDAAVARRIDTMMRPAIPKAYSYGMSPEPSLVESDAGVTCPLRLAVERGLAAAATGGGAEP